MWLYRDRSDRDLHSGSEKTIHRASDAPERRNAESHRSDRDHRKMTAAAPEDRSHRCSYAWACKSACSICQSAAALELAPRRFSTLPSVVVRNRSSETRILSDRERMHAG